MGSQPLVELKLEPRGHAVVVHISGEIDLAAAPRLHSALERILRSRPRVVVLSLSAVSFIDSAGLEALISVREAVVTNQGSLMLAAPSRTVMRVLDLTGLVPLFTALPTVDEALASASWPH